VQVTLADKMPSVGRKFLMAGKSGLNLTKAEPTEVFNSVYAPQSPILSDALSAFGSEAVQDWATGLGQALFIGSTGRVFPKAMKASPLLRAWLARLAARGVTLQTRWAWTGWDDRAAVFDTPDGVQRITADATVLALGGASWARLGSDGAWADLIKGTVPFAPANMGFLREWSPHMAPFIGQPVKGIALRAGDLTSRSEIVLSAQGLEGGGIYEVSRAMRSGDALSLDLVPDLSGQAVAQRWSRKAAKTTLTKFLKSGLRLPPIKIALFHEVTKSAMAQTAQDWQQLIKALPITHDGPRPMDQAISTAGGVGFAALDRHFMLHDRPGVFCAGEMLDWEAPTGGYLITGCLATGQAAALGALAWIGE
jgi:uncharacterized flavoprotein (TIGR03862 family)